MINVNSFGPQLLDFIEHSIRKAIQEPDQRDSPLWEGNCAMVVLDAMMQRHAPELYPFLAFFSDFDLPKIGEESQPTAKLFEALDNIKKLRKVFVESVA